jgi:hypothetical protein
MPVHLPRRPYAAFSFVIALIVASACGGDDDGPTNPNAQSDSLLTVTVDGSTFTAASMSITAALGRLLIIAENGSESMGLGFEVRTGTQTSGTGGTPATRQMTSGQMNIRY